MTETNLYPPINTLKPVCEDVWVVDGPGIEFGPPIIKMTFPTRMTILRLNKQDLFIHSPTELTADLKAAVEEVGVPRWIIGPNKIHYWWIGAWHHAFPSATVYLAPGIVERAGERITFPHLPLDARSGYPWDSEITTLLIGGSFMTEVEVFHRPSRTLILTDLIENFEPRKLTWWGRLLTKLGGVSDPDGQMPRDMRLTFRNERQALKQAVEEMIAWEPERVIFSHGRWYQANGTQELQRAFRWLLR